MKCPSEAELNAYAEDRLSTARRWEVEAHLRDCPGCRTDVAGLDWAMTALAALPADELDEAGHPPLEELAALREGRLPAPRRAAVLSHLGACPECAHIYGHLPREQRALPLTRHWQPLAAAASLLLIVGFVFFVVRGEFAPGQDMGAPPARHADVSRPLPATPVAPAAGGMSAATGPGPDEAVAATPPVAASGASGPRPRDDRRQTDKASVRHTESMKPPPAPPAALHREADAVAPPAPVAPLMLPTGAGGPTPVPAPSGRRMGMTMMQPSLRSEGWPEATPPVAAAAPGGAGGMGMPKMAPDVMKGAAPNRLYAPDDLLANQKPDFLAPPSVRTERAAPGMQGAAPAATRAPGDVAALAVPAAAPMPLAPPPVLTNRVLRDHAWLQQLRNDPPRKARVKALLQQMLRENKSGERREAIRLALAALSLSDAVSPTPVQAARRR